MNTAKTIQQNTEKSQDCLINDKLDFYKWFDNIAPKLAHREILFKRTYSFNQNINEKNFGGRRRAPTNMNVIQGDNNNEWKKITVPMVGGKGFLVNEYAAQIGAKLLFAHYHAAWNGFNR